MDHREVPCPGQGIDDWSRHKRRLVTHRLRPARFRPSCQRLLFGGRVHTLRVTEGGTATSDTAAAIPAATVTGSRRSPRTIDRLA